jgi:hypothetical protein
MNGVFISVEFSVSTISRLSGVYDCCWLHRLSVPTKPHPQDQYVASNPGLPVLGDRRDAGSQRGAMQRGGPQAAPAGFVLTWGSAAHAVGKAHRNLST